MLSVSEVHAICTAWDSYDLNPGEAERIFGEALDDPKRITAMLSEMLEGISDEREQRRIGYAHNYAVIGAYMKQADKKDLKKLIDDLLEVDFCLQALNQWVACLDISYSEECVAAGKLLTPQQLDERIFQRYAPESVELSNTYFKRPGIAIVGPHPLGNSVKFKFDGCAGRRIVHEGNSDLTTLLIRFDDLNAIFFEDAEGFIKMIMDNEKISRYHVVHTQEFKVADYISQRFIFKRAGIFSQRLSRDFYTEQPDHHRI